MFRRYRHPTLLLGLDASFKLQCDQGLPIPNCTKAHSSHLCLESCPFKLYHRCRHGRFWFNETDNSICKKTKKPFGSNWLWREQMTKGMPSEVQHFWMYWYMSFPLSQLVSYDKYPWPSSGRSFILKVWFWVILFFALLVSSLVHGFVLSLFIKGYAAFIVSFFLGPTPPVPDRMASSTWTKQGILWL